jgi:predicted ferric reductase
VVAVCAVPVALWWVAVPASTRFLDLATSLRSVAAGLGVAGASAFACNLILGARLKALEAFFGGLDNLYRTHRRNGRVAYLLLAAHGLLMIASQAVIDPSGVVGFLLPTTSLEVTLGLIALVGMSVSIWLTLYGHLGHEMFVYVQRSFGFIFFVAALHVFLTPGTKAQSPALTYYLAGLFAMGILGFAYRSLLGEVMVPRRDYRVAAINRVGPLVMEITMTPIGKGIDFVPGQFIFVTFRSPALRRHFHPFSIWAEGQFGFLSLRPGAVSNQYHPFSITASSGGGHLSVVVKVVGDYTSAMAKLEAGARARVEGPYGAFSYLKVDNPKQVWIAGGIGLTPFLSMARSLEPSERAIDLYYAMEDGHQGYFLDELYAIADRVPRFRVIPISKDRLGFVTADDIAGVSRRLEEKDILICGPPPMIETLTKQLVAMGVPPGQIHREQFGFV